MRPVVPWPDAEQAEIFTVFAKDPKWETLEGYLKQCFDVVVAGLTPENSRDDDQVAKGMMLMIEHVLKLPKISEKVLTTPKEEEE